MTNQTNFVLIDFENVQPKDIHLLKEGPFKVKVFLGVNQSKIPVSLAASLQSLGGSAEYIILESSGKNALDLHIAYYIGFLSAVEPTAFFHIISKDSGFDPLMKNLRDKKIFVQRSASIADIPYFRSALPVAPKPQVEAVIVDLVRRKDAKPRTIKTLLNTINTIFKKKLSEQELETLLSELCKRGIVKIEGAKVSYALPTEPLQDVEKTASCLFSSREVVAHVCNALPQSIPWRDGSACKPSMTFVNGC
ncbi:MAG: PIN domain-containing protein [Pseudomonadota bacterium]